jgi:formate dehydrogenase subunit gamma
MPGFASSIASSCGLWALGGTIAFLALFWLLRGRIRIVKGWGGFNIPRFGGVERLVHWLLAASFVVLALTSFSREYMVADLDYSQTLPGQLLGGDVFARALGIAWTLYSWAPVPFMAALALAFLLWVRHGLPHWRDAVWLLKGGGLIARGVHPPAHKFNAGQKLLFWTITLGGAWLCIFPGPPILTLVLICVVIVHIYLRTIGIQGAASAMISGEVDANWARQHHSLWAEAEVKRIEESVQSDAAETAAARTP